MKNASPKTVAAKTSSNKLTANKALRVKTGIKAGPTVENDPPGTGG
jgi:hypothetical protein